MARSPKCEACRRRVAKVKGKCRPCYDKAYQEKRRREAGVEPRELVGPASGGVKLEFWVSEEQAQLIRQASGGKVSRWLRDVTSEKIGWLFP